MKILLTIIIIVIVAGGGWYYVTNQSTMKENNEVGSFTQSVDPNLKEKVSPNVQLYVNAGRGAVGEVYLNGSKLMEFSESGTSFASKLLKPPLKTGANEIELRVLTDDGKDDKAGTMFLSDTNAKILIDVFETKDPKEDISEQNRVLHIGWNPSDSRIIKKTFVITSQQ